MKLTERVHVVGRGGWGGLPPLSAGGSCNTFLLDGRTELALVDPGMPEGLDDVLRNIAQAGFDLRRLTTVLLTHAHWDHTAATGELVRRLPHLRVYGHELTRQTLTGEPGIYLPEYRPPGQFPGPVHEVLGEGDTLTVGDVRLRVLHVPGHTPDGLTCLFDAPDGVHAFTGDTAIGDQPGAPGVVGWIEWVWRSNISEFRRSVDRLRAQGFAAFYPGHGNAHLSREAVSVSMRHCVERLDQLLAIPALGSMIPELV